MSQALQCYHFAIEVLLPSCSMIPLPHLLMLTNSPSHCILFGGVSGFGLSLQIEEHKGAFSTSANLYKEVGDSLKVWIIISCVYTVVVMILCPVA